MNAIIAATRTNAALMRIEKEAGTVEEGKRADLIVLDADPLSDPSIFSDPAHVRMVMLGGEVVKDLDAPTHPRRAEIPSGA
jgi:imidazolonepropionase-like amidohydrolase